MAQSTTQGSKTSQSSVSFLTLRYAGAVASALIGLFAVLGALPALFQLWTGSAVGTAPIAGVLSLLGLNSSYSVVMLSIAAVLFSLLAFFLYRRVTKDVAARPDYVTTTAYAAITNALVAVVALVVIVYVADLLTVLVSSLLLIGKNVGIGSMYLNQFLPSLVAAGLAVFVGLMGYQIAKGRNMSLPMTLVLLSVGGALFIATCITVPINGLTGVSTTTQSEKLFPSNSQNNSSNSYDYYNSNGLNLRDYLNNY